MHIPDRWAEVQWCIDHDIEATRHLNFDHILNFTPVTLERLQRVFDASLVARPYYADPNAVVVAILLAINAGKMKRQRRSYSGSGRPVFSPEILTGQRAAPYQSDLSPPNSEGERHV